MFFIIRCTTLTHARARARVYICPR